MVVAKYVEGRAYDVLIDISYGHKQQVIQNNKQARHQVFVPKAREYKEA